MIYLNFEIVLLEHRKKKKKEQGGYSDGMNILISIDFKTNFL
jgi:hypothetical protein